MSVAVHALVGGCVFLAAARVRLVDGRHAAPADEDRSVRVVLADEEAEPLAESMVATEPPAAAPAPPPVASRRAPLTRHRRPQPRTPAVREPAHGTAIEPPGGRVTASPTELPHLGWDLEVGPEPDQLALVDGPGGPGIGTTSAAPQAASAPIAPAESPLIPAGEAGYLRIYETFPSLPASLRRRDRSYVVLLRICIAGDGRVADVLVERGTALELERVIVAAVHTWRYRPRLVAGVPAPFCHRLKLEYAME